MNDINEQTKVPFYVISPMQKLYQMEMEYEKDMERMKALYPDYVQQLMPVIEDYCDGLEYEGSRIYDENPDAMMMRKECEKLIQKVKETPQIQAAEIKTGSRIFPLSPPEGWELPLRKQGQPCSKSCRHNNTAQPGVELSAQSGTQPKDFQDALIGVLFHNEIFRRRSRHRRCCRWW